jgi:hypothetical protein
MTNDERASFPDKWIVASNAANMDQSIMDASLTPDELAAIASAIDECWGHINRAMRRPDPQ